MNVRILPNEVIKAGAAAFMIPVQHILEDRRHKGVVVARHALFKALKLRGSSYGQIGRWMSKDRTTVVYGVRRAEKRMELDGQYNDIIQSLAALTGAA